MMFSDVVIVGCPVLVELALGYSASEPVVSHIILITFNFSITLLFTTSSSVVLSVCIGVGGSVCPKYSSVFCAGMASQQLMKRAPISAPAADAMTVLMI